jgi:hypothetical protein
MTIEGNVYGEVDTEGNQTTGRVSCEGETGRYVHSVVCTARAIKQKTVRHTHSPSGATGADADGYATKEGETMKYSKKDWELVEALLTHPTKTAAARALGISRQKLYKRLQKESVRELLDMILRERVQHLSRYSVSLVERAWARIEELLNSENEFVAIRAATLILSKFAPVPPEITENNIELDDDLSA